MFRESVLAFMGAGNEGKCDERQKKKCQIEFGEFFEWACKNCEKKVKGL